MFFYVIHKIKIFIFPKTSGLVDLAAFENGGIGVACSDEHFGKMKNLGKQAEI